MKSLILKDWYLATKNCWAYIIVIVPFLAISLFADTPILFTFSFPVLLTSVTSINIITYDEKCRWQNYSLSMPYTRKQIVASKYIMAAILSCSLSLLGGITQIVSCFINGNAGEISALYLMFTICVLILIGIVSPCLIFPFIFKMGVEKGKILYVIIMGFIGFIMGFFMNVMTDDEMIEMVSDLSEKDILISIAVILASDVVIYFGSWALSSHAYGKRDL